MKDDIIKRQNDEKIKLETKVKDLEKILTSLVVNNIIYILEFTKIKFTKF
jgi:hypothetical protein